MACFDDGSALNSSEGRPWVLKVNFRDAETGLPFDFLPVAPRECLVTSDAYSMGALMPRMQQLFWDAVRVSLPQGRRASLREQEVLLNGEILHNLDTMVQFEGTANHEGDAPSTGRFTEVTLSVRGVTRYLAALRAEVPDNAAPQSRRVLALQMADDAAASPFGPDSPNTARQLDIQLRGLSITKKTGVIAQESRLLRMLADREQQEAAETAAERSTRGLTVVIPSYNPIVAPHTSPRDTAPQPAVHNQEEIAPSFSWERPYNVGGGNLSFFSSPPTKDGLTSAHQAELLVLLERYPLKHESGDPSASAGFIGNYAQLLSSVGNRLWWAASLGEVNVVRELLACRQVDINYQRQERDGTPLWRAASLGFSQVVELLLAFERVRVNEVDHNGQTPLWAAAYAGHAAVVATLLCCPRVDVNQSTPDNGWTPLFAAVLEEHNEVVRSLLNCSRVDVNRAESGTLTTPLLLAADIGGSLLIGALLASERCEVNQMNESGSTALLVAASLGRRAATETLLRCKRVDVNQGDSRGSTPLWVAANRGFTGVVDVLLRSAELDINGLHPEAGNSALWTAVGRGEVGVVEVLLRSGRVDVNLADREGVTPVWLAAKMGHVRVMSALLAAGDGPQVDVNHRHPQEGTAALWVAVSYSNEEIVRLLLSAPGHFVDVNQTDLHGATPLIVAAGIGHAGVVRALLESHYVQVTWADREGMRTPLWAAAAGGHLDAVRELLRCGRPAAVNQPDRFSGSTPLQVATMNGNATVVFELLDTCPDLDVNKTDLRGEFPLWSAANRGDGATVAALLRHPKMEVNRVDTEKGGSSLMAAARAGNVVALEVLLNCPKVRVNQADLRGATPLWAASCHGHTPVVAFLLRCPQVRVNQPDDVEGLFPLTLAAGNGHVRVVKLLLKSGRVSEMHWKTARTTCQVMMTAPNIDYIPGRRRCCQIILRLGETPERIRMRPNDLCSCGSQRKYKRCCGMPPAVGPRAT